MVFFFNVISNSGALSGNGFERRTFFSASSTFEKIIIKNMNINFKKILLLKVQKLILLKLLIFHQRRLKVPKIYKNLVLKKYLVFGSNLL
jgi:hypothetical protein